MQDNQHNYIAYKHHNYYNFNDYNINVDNLDSDCHLPRIVIGKPCQTKPLGYILKNSFGMLGINAVLVLRAPEEGSLEE